MPATRARPLTNAERQRRYRARRAAEYRQAVAEGRTLLHTYCRELVGDPARVAWLVAHGMTARRCRFVEEYIMPRLPFRDSFNAAVAYRLAGYAPKWSAVNGPKLRATYVVAVAIRWALEHSNKRLGWGMAPPPWWLPRL